MLSLSCVSAPASTARLGGALSGVIKDSDTGAPIANALVILQCTCLDEQREASANAQGVYAFDRLPAGRYTVQVLVGEANVSKVFELPSQARFRGNFAVDPQSDEVIVVVVGGGPTLGFCNLPPGPGDEADTRRLPLGADVQRDFTAVAEPKPSRTRTRSRRASSR